MSGIVTPYNPQDAANAFRAEGWAAEVDAGAHMVNAAINIGNGNYGTAGVEIVNAVLDKAQAIQIYYHANRIELQAAQELVAANNAANPRHTGDWGCVIL